MSAPRIVSPLVAMLKPPASFSDDGWRAIAMCGTRWMVAARYEDAVIVENGVIKETWDAEAHAKLFATAPELLAALSGYVERQKVANATLLRTAPDASDKWLEDAEALIAKATGSQP